ncbi:hypothetical protein evm_001763 [Chilo suppressalis]|nr:hypothetical protein evm_001763 [Chilo suppressalis]
MEEQACLNSSKLSFGSISRTMAYTEDRLTVTEGAGEPGNTVNMSASAPDHTTESNESGELLDYNDCSVLEQFHEDALRQAGCGLSQVRVLIACGLAIGGSALELAAIPFILPSAEIELCILRHEKSWLVLISLVGASLGSVGWGALCERLGRRRTLLSCLAVNAVFAAVAAFMPTYGTFMMARFCSALGSGGITGACYAYAWEVVGRGRGGRARALAVLPLAGGAGALTAAALARATLPPTGAETLHENRAHFSAWHRYLLLCTLPILASLISLIWTPESPRYLLDVGREVDAMGVYQNIHTGNQIRICGKSQVGRADSEYRLGELALPGKRRAPALHHVRHSVKMFWQAFFQLFSGTYRTATLSLGGIMLFMFAIQFYLSSYVPATVVSKQNALLEVSKQIEQNATYEKQHYNQTLDNIEFANVTFVECTFRDMLMSRVSFRNCSFVGVAFANIKTSNTGFYGCSFVNTTIIDSDIEFGRELDPWCVLHNTVIRGMRGGCRADLASSLAGLVAEQGYAAHAAILGAALANIPRLHQALLYLCAACVLLSPSLYILQSETALYIVEAVYRLFITLILYIVSIKVLETYPANLRCTALGLILSVGYMGAAIVRGVGDTSAILSCVLCCCLALASAALSLTRPARGTD